MQTARTLRVIMLGTEDGGSRQAPERGSKAATRFVISSVEQHDTLSADLSVRPVRQRPRSGTLSVVEKDINTLGPGEK
jgi:hypothetical protein